MANLLYDTFKEGILGNIAFDLDTDTINAILVDGADYTFSAAHNFATGASRNITAVATVSSPQALGSPTVVNGVFDTADFTWSTVSGDESENVVIYDGTLTDGQLIAFYDTGMTGMPVTPNGGDINVTVNGSGWFAI